MVPLLIKFGKGGAHVADKGGDLGNLGYPPAQDASHHPDYYIFRLGDPYQPSFATVTGTVNNPMYKQF